MIKFHRPDGVTPQALGYPFAVTNIMRAEKRAADGGELVRVEGVASVTGHDYEVYGGPDTGGWIERIEPGAFRDTLADRPDVVYLINHTGLPIARTTSGTLQLREAENGLSIGAYLDRRSGMVNDLLVAMERGDVNEMSFGFRVPRGGYVWSEHPDFPGDQEGLRSIRELNMNRGDVSSVTYGANPATDSGIVRSARAIIRSVEVLDQQQLDEIRAAIERRMTSKPTLGGMPGGQDQGGMPSDVAAVLALPLPPSP